MIRLALRGMRFRKSSFVATFVAVLIGAAIVMACGGLMETGIRANVPAERLAAAPVVVTGKQSYTSPGSDEGTPLPERVRLPASVVAAVRAVPGVTGAVGEVSFPATVLRNGRPVASGGLGHDWVSARLAPYTLRSGHAPQHAGEVLLDSATARQAAAKAGSRVQMAIRGRTATYTVSGVAHGPAGQTFFETAEAARLAGPGMVDAIGVTVAPGTDIGALKDRIEAAAGERAVVLTGADRGMAEHLEAADREGLIALAGSFGGISTMTMMFVVASTLALTVQHRQRELAMMRTVGTTPGQVRRMVLVETLLVSVPAVLVGCLPGLFLGEFLFERLSGHGVVSPLMTYRQGLLPLVVGAGAALLAAIGAGLLAGRRAGRTRPIEALTDAGLQRKWFGWVRFVTGMLFLGGGLALVIVTFAVMDGPLAGATAGPSVLCWAIGVALLGPGITKGVVGLLRWPLYAVSGTSGRLAILNVSARTVAMSSAVMPVMLATGIATANLYMQTTQVNAAEEAFTSTLRADAVVTSQTGALPPGLLDRVRRTPGVASASAYVTSLGVVDEPRSYRDTSGTPLQGISAQGADGTAAVRLTAGSLTGLTGDTLALPDTEGAKLGDQVALTLGDGAQVKLRVVATYAGQPGYDTILLPVDLLAAHTTTGTADQILVRAADGVSPSDLSRALAAPGVVVADREAIVAEHNEGLQTQAWVNYLIVGLLVAYTAVSVVNTLAAATTRRRREFGLQRLTGSTPGQVLRMMAGEGVLVALAGVLLGTLVALATLVPFSAAVADSALPSGPIAIYLVIVGAALVLTLGATMVPAALSLRSRPAEAASAID
jgi:putative ABC transport system permease protein